MNLPPANTISAIEFTAFMEEVWEKAGNEDYFRFENAIDVAIELGAKREGNTYTFPNGAVVYISGNGAGIYESAEEIPESED